CLVAATGGRKRDDERGDGRQGHALLVLVPVHADATRPRSGRFPFHRRDQPSSGRYGPRSARSPLALTTASATASGQAVRPAARRVQVRGSVSTTFGGVPRVCRGPSTHRTAANGGTRTSVEPPGAFWASASASSRVQAARA